MSISITLFGSLADKAGKSQLTLNGCKDTNALQEMIMNEFPLLKECAFMIAIDKKITRHNQQLKAGNQVAFLPPFAGG